MQYCIDKGYDPSKECIPVVPAQHYFMGGIKVDHESRTTMDNLYAIGETACNGVHGRNRLASNSLLESLVFAKRAALDITENAYEGLGGEYAILIKLHPFCEERFEIPEKYSDMIIDMSDEDELNDLLFVTDLLVTDYSSVIFEASLLNIPMMFYAFDLYDNIASRDFYYDFEGFVPGKIVFSENELINAINKKDFESEKVDGFKNKFLDDLDGKSSERVTDLILENLDI